MENSHLILDSKFLILKNMKKLPFLIIILGFIFAGCGQKATENIIDATTGIGAIEKKIQAEKDIARAQCIELCRGTERGGIDLSRGPCIGNPIPNMQNWVCDVAHNPRQDVDNKTENQCSSFAEGKAKHFVEVDERCNFIKSY